MFSIRHISGLSLYPSSLRYVFCCTFYMGRACSSPLSRSRSDFVIRFLPEVRRTTRIKRTASITGGLHDRKLFFLRIAKSARIELVLTERAQGHDLAQCAKIMDPRASSSTYGLSWGFHRSRDVGLSELFSYKDFNTHWLPPYAFFGALAFGSYEISATTSFHPPR